MPSIIWGKVPSIIEVMLIMSENGKLYLAFRNGMYRRPLT
jgi:hypothetical protein